MSKAQFKVVVGALRDNKYLKEVIRQEDLVKHEELSFVLNKGVNYFRGKNTFPTNTVLKDIIADDVHKDKKIERYNKLVDKIYTSEINDTDFYHFLSKAKSERKDRYVKQGLSSVIDLLEDGSKDKAEKSLLSLADTLRKRESDNRIKRGSALDDEYVDYYIESEDRSISLSLDGLNNILGGGTIPGDIMIWQAGTGRGKSLALMEQADYAFEQGYNVAFFVVEMGLRKMQDRFLSRRSDYLYNLVKSRQVPIDIVQDERDKVVTANNAIEIIDVPINSSTEIIRLELEDYVRRHSKIDVVIVDPVYMIKALNDADASWEEKGNALLELKQIGSDYDSVMHTANQIKNKDLNKLDPDTDSGSQSFLYGAGADIMANIIMTDKMRKNKVAKIKLPKARDGQAGASIFIKTAYEKMQFSNGEIENLELEQEGDDF